VIEATADAQLHRFCQARKPGEIMSRGLWAYSRHPNYFGEISFWWGLWLFGLAADPGSALWTLAGPAAITALFVFVSVPLIDKRSLARRPGYAEHSKRISAIVPWFPKKA
jgi:steroid 5-alpha reductase family enzyme